MPRAKRKSHAYLAKKLAAKRRQETPEQRAARLESRRKYARFCRENETESQREDRLESMRHYNRSIRQRKKSEISRQRLALVTERFTVENEKIDVPEETVSHYEITDKD